MSSPCPPSRSRPPEITEIASSSRDEGSVGGGGAVRARPPLVELGGHSMALALFGPARRTLAAALCICIGKRRASRCGPLSRDPTMLHRAGQLESVDCLRKVCGVAVPLQLGRISTGAVSGGIFDPSCNVSASVRRRLCGCGMTSRLAAGRCVFLGIVGLPASLLSSRC